MEDTIVENERVTTTPEENAVNISDQENTYNNSDGVTSDENMILNGPGLNQTARKNEKTKIGRSCEFSQNDNSIHPAKKLVKKSEMFLRKSKSKVTSDDFCGIKYKFIPDPCLLVPPIFSGTVEAFKIGPEPKTKNFIAAVLYKIHSDYRTSKTKTIIYSHGNATDIGAMNFMQSIMAKGLQSNILMYDYSGYGASSGVPLESNTYLDIEIVYKWVTENVVQDRNEREIVLYGQSVGSGPSCYLCAKNKNVGGLILHSPIMSGMRVLTSSRALSCLDIYPNIDRMKKVHCPVMVIHGVMDEEVDISHGQALHDAVRGDLKREPWWVPDRGHNNLTDGRIKQMEYISRLKSYLKSLD